MTEFTHIKKPLTDGSALPAPYEKGDRGIIGGIKDSLMRSAGKIDAILMMNKGPADNIGGYNIRATERGAAQHFKADSYEEVGGQPERNWFKLPWTDPMSQFNYYAGAVEKSARLSPHPPIYENGILKISREQYVDKVLQRTALGTVENLLKIKDFDPNARPGDGISVGSKMPKDDRDKFVQRLVLEYGLAPHHVLNISLYQSDLNMARWAIEKGGANINEVAKYEGTYEQHTPMLKALSRYQAYGSDFLTSPEKGRMSLASESFEKVNEKRVGAIYADPVVQFVLSRGGKILPEHDFAYARYIENVAKPRSINEARDPAGADSCHTGEIYQKLCSNFFSFAYNKPVFDFIDREAKKTGANPFRHPEVIRRAYDNVTLVNPDSPNYTDAIAFKNYVLDKAFGGNKVGDPALVSAYAKQSSKEMQVGLIVDGVIDKAQIPTMIKESQHGAFIQSYLERNPVAQAPAVVQ